MSEHINPSHSKAQSSRNKKNPKRKNKPKTQSIKKKSSDSSSKAQTKPSPVQKKQGAKRTQTNASRTQQPKANKHLPAGLTILYEDRDILVVNKPIGLLSMGHAKERIQTAYYALTQYVKKGQRKSPHRLFIVHRLDRDTSGILLLAKTAKAKKYLQEQWGEFQKFYSAIVHGHPEAQEATLRHHLAENKAHRVYVTQDKDKGKLARTRYRVVEQNKTLSLLDIELLSGRKNQIRVQLAEHGHPVIGDRKYGRTEDKFRKMALHARELRIKHPHSHKPMTFTADLPTHFDHLLGQRKTDAKAKSQTGAKIQAKQTQGAKAEKAQKNKRREPKGKN